MASLRSLLAPFLLFITAFAIAGLAALAEETDAVEMIATVYNDGRSCPGGCDAHVVFNPVHNGTRNAFDPAGGREEPMECQVGQPCRICFSEADSSCMLATYRGAGPGAGRFDFTPAFFTENCSKENLPEPFARECRDAAPAVTELRLKINCVANPSHERCRNMMESAERRKAADDLLYAECKSLGQAAFNQKYRNDRNAQRSADCAYERFARPGRQWRRLLDGACAPGNYAGREGLDCCSGNLYEAALFGRECRGFFADP